MSEKLYSVREDVKCLGCGGKGAIQFYGEYYRNGMGDEAQDFISLQEYRNKPYMSVAMGYGGTVPHRCLNCGNTGLIGFGGLEGYKQAFETIQQQEG